MYLYLLFRTDRDLNQFCMCEFMHQTYVARPVDLSHFVIVKGDRSGAFRAFAMKASLLCRLQKTLEDSRNSCGELHQVAELLFAGELTRVPHHDRSAMEVQQSAAGVLDSHLRQRVDDQ